MSCKIVVRVVAGIILPALFVLGQTDAPVVRATASGAPASGAASAPVYVLYRLFFGTLLQWMRRLRNSTPTARPAEMSLEPHTRRVCC